MIDHRRTPSQRAYQLPGWFFVLTVLLSVVALGAVGWVFVGDRLDRSAAAPEASASGPARAPEPEPADSRSTSGSADDEDKGDPADDGDEVDAAGGDDADEEPARPDIDVVVLNASQTPGLARRIAGTAEEAGWTVAEVGNWPYPAVVNAVYYPDGRQDEARQLADDVGVDGVRAARPGMSTDALTVLLVSSP